MVSALEHNVRILHLAHMNTLCCQEIIYTFAYTTFSHVVLLLERNNGIVCSNQTEKSAGSNNLLLSDEKKI